MLIYLFILSFFLCLVTYMYIFLYIYTFLIFFYTSRMLDPHFYLSASLTIHMAAPDAVPKSTVGFGHTPPKLPIHLGTYTCSTIAARDCCFLLMKFEPAKARPLEGANAGDNRPCESTYTTRACTRPTTPETTAPARVQVAPVSLLTTDMLPS